MLWPYVQYGQTMATISIAVTISKAINDTRITKKTIMQDKLFLCPKLTLKMQQQEAAIDSLLNGLKHVPHPFLTVTEDQQSDIHITSIPCT